MYVCINVCRNTSSATITVSDDSFVWLSPDFLLRTAEDNLATFAILLNFLALFSPSFFDSCTSCMSYRTTKYNQHAITNT